MVNATLVAWLLSRLGCSRLAALFASLVYAAHITHFHGLVTPATFQEVLATFFVFSALALYLRQEAAPAGNRWLPTLTVTCFGAALLSKESAFSFPFLLTWLEIVRASPSSPSSALWMRWRRTTPFYAIAGIRNISVCFRGLPVASPTPGLDFSVSDAFSSIYGGPWFLSLGLYESNWIILLFAGLVIIFGVITSMAWAWMVLISFPVLFLPKRMALN
jgi:hypothetical protein